MAKPWASSQETENRDSSTLDWRRSMSDNVAYALLVYTGIQIFATVKVMKDGGHSILPYLALVVLVALIIPFCRIFERRWTHLSDAEASDPGLAGAYRSDQIKLWALAIGMPVVLTLIIKAITTIF